MTTHYLVQFQYYLAQHARQILKSFFWKRAWPSFCVGDEYMFFGIEVVKRGRKMGEKRKRKKKTRPSTAEEEDVMILVFQKKQETSGGAR